MASSLKTPGVYIQEVSNADSSVAQVETAIPAFIGYTETANQNGNDVSGIPLRISSFLEYEQIFGGPNACVTVNIDETSGKLASVVVATMKHYMYYSLQMYFANGGGPCYIVSVALYPAIGQPQVSKVALKAGLDTLVNEDEPTLIVYPDATSIYQLSYYGGLMVDTLTHCAKMQDRFAIMDTYTDTYNDIGLFRTSIGVNNLKYGAVYYPRLITTLDYIYNNTQVKIHYNGSTLNNQNLAQLITAAQAIPANSDPNLAAALVTNSFLSTIKTEIDKTVIILPPSSTIAGVYASVDAARGVWKAPANVALSSVVAPSVKITDEDQRTLNVDTDGKSINAIRAFTGKGILVWGARTLAGNDNEWRYVNVRRLFITAEESIKKTTNFVVFESNDANTWIRIKSIIANYLTGLWKQGALAGATPDEAFFVNVGLGTTMTTEDILNGILNIEVGIAAVRPAEFIILSFSHSLQLS